jgi:hypothetical protein
MATLDHRMRRTFGMIGSRLRTEAVAQRWYRKPSEFAAEGRKRAARVRRRRASSAANSRRTLKGLPAAVAEATAAETKE